MSPRYIRKRPAPMEELAAGVVSAALGATVGIVAFYFVRLMLSREALPPSLGSTPGPRRTEEE